MTRFRQATSDAIPFSEIKPERFDPVRLLDLADPASKRRLAEMRRVFMEEIPLPEEIAAAQPRQLRGNK